MTDSYSSPHGPVADLPGEEWRDWEDMWEISNLGRFKAKEKLVENPRGVWRLRERLLTAHDPIGERYVKWYRWQVDGKSRSMSVYRMMWIAFIGPVADDEHIFCSGDIRLDNLFVPSRADPDR